METETSESKIYDLEYQKRCLMKMKSLLESSKDQGNLLRSKIEEKIQYTLGVRAIPSTGLHQDIMYPFVTFDGNGHFHVSFLFDSPPKTFWKMFFRSEFGAHFLALQKEIYSLVTSPPHKIDQNHESIQESIRPQEKRFLPPASREDPCIIRTRSQLTGYEEFETSSSDSTLYESSSLESDLN